MNQPTTDQLQEQFSDRLVAVFTEAARLMSAEQVYEAALGAAAGFALHHASGPAAAETMRRLAAELQSRRRTDPPAGISH